MHPSGPRGSVPNVVSSTVRRQLIRRVGLALAGYLLLCLALYLFQRNLVFVPGGPPLSDPGALGLEFDDLRLETADGERIHAWRIRARATSAGGAARGLVLYSHGNAGNIATRLHRAELFADWGFDVLLFDYRGFGRSTGSPTEQGTYLDAERVWEYATVEAGYDARRIVLVGESLGCAVAVELATRREVAAVALESGFTSIVDMGRERYPFLPVGLLARDRYASIDKVGELDVPLLVLHSPDDEVIEIEHGRRLAAAAGAPFHELEAGHNDGGFTRRATDREAMRQFLDAAIGATLEARE